MPLTTSEAAARAGCGPRHIIWLIHNQVIKATRESWAWEIDETSFEAWLAEREGRPAHRGPDIWFHGHWQTEDDVRRNRLKAAIRRIERRKE